MITIDISTAFSVIAILLSSVALYTTVTVYKAMNEWRTRFHELEASLPSLRREVELVASISARTGRQVKRIEHDYSDVADRVDMVESRAPAKSLDEAIDSARHGADTGKLTRQFGLSRGEAELVARLHGNLKTA
jgi:Protein of unknown function (DUF2802)